MPELPEVETVVRDLNHSALPGKKISRVQVHWHRSADPTIKQIEGQTILSINRRAKFIVFELPKGFFIIHLRMTGKLLLEAKTAPRSAYERVCFTLSDGQELRFVDTRKFGRVYFTSDAEQFFEAIGPEPLASNFSWQELKAMLGKRSTQLKSLLLNQRFIAGLGNIYVDEALWLAKLHPLRKANTLSDHEIQMLFTAIQQALQLGLLNNGATLGNGKTNFYRLDGSKGNFVNALNVFRQTGKPCKTCGHIIQKIKAAGRSTHICNNCQK